MLMELEPQIIARLASLPALWEAVSADFPDAAFSGLVAVGADGHQVVVEFVEQRDGLDGIEPVRLAIQEEAAEVFGELDAQLTRTRRIAFAHGRGLGKQQRITEAADAHVLVGEDADGAHLDLVAAPAIAQRLQLGGGFVGVHLASDDAGFVTGQNIAVNGGSAFL